MFLGSGRVNFQTLYHLRACRPPWSYDVDHLNTWHPLPPPFWRLYTKFYQNWPSGFRGEALWKCGRRTATNDGACPSYKLQLKGWRSKLIIDCSFILSSHYLSVSNWRKLYEIYIRSLPSFFPSTYNCWVIPLFPDIIVCIRYL